MGVSLVLVLAAGGLAHTAAALPPNQQEEERPPTPRPASSCSDLSEGSRDVRVAWGRPTATSTCFFFSGPGQLGRDDHLGDRARWTRQGERVRLAFGSAVFEGTLNGSRLRLTRSSDHQFGSRWVATETIEGQLVQSGEPSCRVLRATYSYRECDTANARDCPSVCTIRAALALQ